MLVLHSPVSVLFQHDIRSLRTTTRGHVKLRRLTHSLLRFTLAQPPPCFCPAGTKVRRRGEGENSGQTEPFPPGDTTGLLGYYILLLSPSSTSNIEGRSVHTSSLLLHLLKIRSFQITQEDSAVSLPSLFLSLSIG